MAEESYQDIIRKCQRAGRKWEDPEFPAVNSSIFYSRPPPKPFEWKRPNELCDDPKMFVKGASRFDVKQGELGDCWLLAAVASLAQHKQVLYQVVDEDEHFENGVVCFKFWQYGKWEEVLVDDRLPTYYGRLVFMHSVDNNEFWTPLLEKAYAKLNGSYEALKGGSAHEAMEDFTGGVTEMYDFRQGVPSNFFQIMQKAFERGSFMGCSIEALPGRMEAELSNGLIMGHAYTITSVKQIEIQTSRKSGKIPMVRVRNPWGNEAEWKGAWSDKSAEWKFISDDERCRIGLTFNDDGEFWMSYQDFSTNFQKVEICNLGPECPFDPAAFKKRWESTAQNGSWKRRVSAGGCRNYLDTFWTNPQFRVEVVDPDEDDEEELGTILVGLMQKGRRKKRKEGLDLLTIGYVIYKLPSADCAPLDMEFFKYNASIAKSPAFINQREVCGRHKLKPGHYCIIPSTFEPHQEGDFLLRIYSEQPNVSGEIDEQTVRSETQVKVENSPTDDKVSDIIRQTFHKISGEDMEIDAYELKDILNAAFMREFNFDGFSNETCRSMVAMMDKDRSGKLGFEEFKKLWLDLRLWKSVFKKHDKDHSGNFNSFELREAFHTVGFKVSNATFKAMVMRYSGKDGKIAFDDFILCVVRLKSMFETFEENKRGSNAHFSLDDFIQTTMYS